MTLIRIWLFPRPIAASYQVLPPSLPMLSLQSECNLMWFILAVAYCPFESKTGFIGFSDMSSVHATDLSRTRSLTHSFLQFTPIHFSILCKRSFLCGVIRSFNSFRRCLIVELEMDGIESDHVYESSKLLDRSHQVKTLPRHVCLTRHLVRSISQLSTSKTRVTRLDLPQRHWKCFIWNFRLR